MGVANLISAPTIATTGDIASADIFIEDSESISVPPTMESTAVEIDLAKIEEATRESVPAMTDMDATESADAVEAAANARLRAAALAAAQRAQRSATGPNKEQRALLRQAQREALEATRADRAQGSRPEGSFPRRGAG